MKKTKFLTTVAIGLFSFCVSACGTPTTEDTGTGWTPGDETYTVTFISEDSVVQTYENLTFGTYVDIPQVQPSSDRLLFKGWTDIDDEDLEAGKVMVYESDAIYYAKWSERFGTTTVFEAMQRKIDNEIVVDGQKDVAYTQATPIEVNTVSNGSTDATAKAYVMWDEFSIYILVEVKDATYNPYSSGNINDSDSVNIYIDLLHDDKYAVENYSTGWGGSYRGEPGPMCEGLFKIGAGVSYPNEDARYGHGSEFLFDGWLSNAAKEGGQTVGTTCKTDVGYNVEYRIDCTNENIPNELRGHIGHEIGIGINVFDKGTNATSLVCLEDINKDMNLGPKKLSNFVLVANPLQDKNIYPATHVRESYIVNNKDQYDSQFNDAPNVNIGDSVANILWDEQGIYYYFTFGENTNSIKIESELLSSPVTLNKSGKVVVPETGLAKSDYVEFDFVINNDEENKIESSLYLVENTHNVTPSRKLFEADYLEANETITVDGIKDDAYLSTPAINVNENSLVEDSQNLGATGVAYIKWDNEYLYIFVEVTDANVDDTTENTSSPELNDSVEIWLSTCQTLPTLSTRWGWPTGGINSLRPSADFCGEGKFARRAGNPNNPTCGTHWMWDNTELVHRETASVVTETGYTTEFKIGLGTFATKTEDKLNEIIDIGININDGENNKRKGVVCLNVDSHRIHEKPGYLDHLILVNK